MEWNDQMMDDALRESAASLEKNYPANLPPAPELWAAIDSKRKSRKVIRLQPLWAVAATTLLLTTAIAVWVTVKKEAPLTVVHHQLPATPTPATENEAMNYIRQLCMGNNIVCYSPAFKELQSELDSSSTDLSAINQQLKLFGDDEQLLRAKTRIENHQARIVKAMLQIL